MALLSVGRRTHQFNVNISRLEKLHWWLITPRFSGTRLLRRSLRKNAFSLLSPKCLNQWRIQHFQDWRHHLSPRRWGRDVAILYFGQFSVKLLEKDKNLARRRGRGSVPVPLKSTTVNQGSRQLLTKLCYNWQYNVRTYRVRLSKSFVT